MPEMDIVKPKTVKTKYETLEAEVLHQEMQNGTFSPIIIERKRQTKLTGFEDKCIALYAKGMSYRDIGKNKFSKRNIWSKNWKR